MLPDSLRIGAVNHANVRPLTIAIPRPVETATPRELAQRFRQGDLDVALLPIAAAWESPGTRIVEGFGISSHGKVLSVIVRSHVPLEKLESVSPNPSSRSSNLLLECLTSQDQLLPGRSIRIDPDSEQAELIMADEALHWIESGPDPASYIDLGEAWARWQQLPFVYAAWLIRPGLAETAQVAEALRRHAAEGISQLPQILATSTFSSLGREYFTKSIHYTLRAQEKKGLEAFVRLVAPPETELVFV